MANENARRELLGKKLQSSDAEERREAAIDLGRSGRESAPLLLRALGDPDWRVRKTAVEALVLFRGVGVIDGLIQLLSAHDNAGARNSAIEALVHIGAETVDPLLGHIATPDVDVRKFIIDILGDIRDPRAVLPLIERLNDADENISVATAEALGKIRDRRAVPALTVCLARYDQGWLDYAAAEALGEIGDESALGPLIAALGRSSLREPVLESLGKIGNVSTLAPLVAGLADPLRIVREVSVVALATIYRKSDDADRKRVIEAVRNAAGEQAVVFLEELLLTSGGELLKASIAVLGWAGKESSITKLLDLLREEELEDAVTRALKNIDGGRVRILIDHLASENALVRRVVAQVLGEVKSAEAEQPLIKLLSDENGHVRSTAAEALGRLQSRKAALLLLQLLEDEYESVQDSAISALAAIGDDTVLEGLVKDFTSHHEALRRNIALLLGAFATDKAADALAFALKDEEPEVRKAVVQSLGKLAEAKAVKPLLLAITDDDPEVRMLAAEALGRTSAAEASEALVPLLEDEDLWVRAAAARGLGRVGGEKAGELLLRQLERASDIYLLALVEVLGRLMPAGALSPLLKLCGHADPEVRKTVLSALSAYSGPEVRKAFLAGLEDPHWSVRKTAVELATGLGDLSARTLLAKLAGEDPDHIVRQAANEALRS